MPDEVLGSSLLQTTAWCRGGEVGLKEKVTAAWFNSLQHRQSPRYIQTLAKLKLTITLRPEAVSLLLSSREHCCRVLWQCYSRGQEECFGQHASSPVLLLSLGQDFTWKDSQRCIAKRARDYSSLLPIVITYPCKTITTRQQEPLFSLLQFQSNVPGLFHYLDINKLTQKEGGNFIRVLHIIFPII